jgi:predicted  nucleic acid-binding Zn-ribbon protein
MTLDTAQKALVSLQALDAQIAKLDARVEQAEQKRHIAAARAKLAEGEQRLARLQEALDELDLKTAQLQTEAEQAGVKIATEQLKLQNSSDHREASALSQELGTLIKQREKQENEALILMEKRQQYADARIDTEVKMNRLREIETRELASYKTLYKTVNSAKAELLSQRESLLKHLKPDIIARYEELRRAKGGIAVARYHKGKCEGCAVSIAVVERAAIEASEDIPTCPNCKRLLVVDTDA